LNQAELIIEVQKKISQMLGIPLETSEKGEAADENRRSPDSEVGTKPACAAVGINRPVCIVSDAQEDAPSGFPENVHLPPVL